MVFIHSLIAALLVAQPPMPTNVALSLTSPQDGLSIQPATTVVWEIRAELSDGDSMGLACILVDLVQSPSNPAIFDIPPAASVPTAMSGFSRPAGYSNPVPGNPSQSAYGGTQVGTTGAKNLAQIGGMQNTFGLAGTTMGTDTAVNGGIGQQSGGQLIATGSFAAPCTHGSFSFSLANGVANALENLGTGTNPSFVHSARVTLGPSIYFTIPACDSADFDGDGDTGTDLDIEAFFACLGGNCCPTCGDADFNNDCDTGNDSDIEAFFRILGGLPC